MEKCYLKVKYTVTLETEQEIDTLILPEAILKNQTFSLPSMGIRAMHTKYIQSFQFFLHGTDIIVFIKSCSGQQK